MVDIYLNYDKLTQAYKKYLDIRRKKNEWMESNKDLMNVVDPTNFGNWRDMFDTQTQSINNDIILFGNDLDGFCNMFNKADDLSCKLLNRAYDFYEILGGSEPMADYPICLMQDTGKDLFYSSDHHDDIRSTNAEITEYYEAEIAQLDLIDTLCGNLQWLSKNCMDSEKSAVRTAILPESYIEPFDTSFEQYALDVASFNEIIGAMLDALSGDVSQIPQQVRDYTFDQTNLNDKQKAELWFAEFIDDDYKQYYIDMTEYDTYIMEVYTTYVNATGPAKDLFNEYRGNIIIKTMVVDSGISYHNSGKLYIAAARNINDPRGDGNVFYHETGHLIVYSTGARNSPEMEAFDKALKEGVTAYVASIEQSVRDKYKGSNLTPEEIEEKVVQETTAILQQQLWGNNNQDYHVYDGVSDMIDAATNHKYVISYSHSLSDPLSFLPWHPTYWDWDPDRQCDEAFAEIFAAEMCGDKQEIEFIKNNFGDVYDRYQDLCRSMEGAKQ
ncbi:MAG: hypothetical protein K6G10_09895 [Butyrivibrio sp.]|nr:hypothetical protein [Butyrivibrio sp.]